MSDKIDRKIAVIFATDVVGYSKYMEANESETVKNLRVCEKILTKLFKKHGGSLFNTGGDSFLAEFPSAVGAVECAVEFQNQIKTRNASEDTTVKLQFRVGVNTGDVIKEKGNLLGDGVNIAARLESLAQTGGITISKGVYDYVKGKTKCEYNDLGVQKVKQNEFHAYDLLLDPTHKRKMKSKKTNMPLIGAIVAVFIVGLIGIFYFNKDTQTIDYKNNKINLLVMPFEAVSNDENSEVIASGITDHISTTLANFDELFIFDKSSADYFLKNSISRELLSSDHNVKFRLDGKVQSSDLKIRVNIKLENIAENDIVWSEVLDFETKDIFDVQDKITDMVLSKIIPNVMSLTVGNSKVVHSFTPEVHLNRLKGRVAFESQSIEGMYEYEKLLNLNRTLEPNNVYLDMDEAWLLMGKIWFGMSNNVEQDVNKAYELTLNTVRADPDFAYATSLASMIERNYIGKLDKACTRLDKLIEISIDPSNKASAANLARHCGQYDIALNLYKNIYKSAPHFSLWFKKDYAWTFLISNFDDQSYGYEDAKLYIKSQLAANYPEPGINELWLSLLAYISSKEGDIATAKKYIKRQANLDNPIEVSWKKSHPNILNENLPFKKDFFQTLNSLGLNL